MHLTPITAKLSMSKAAAKRKEQVRKTATKKAPRAGRSKATAKGLWVNWEFLRSLSKRAPQTVVHLDSSADYNRILKLADIMLANPVERRHVEKRTLAFAKKQESKKRKSG